jgi:hypothetical protein
LYLLALLLGGCGTSGATTTPAPTAATVPTDAPATAAPTVSAASAPCADLLAALVAELKVEFALSEAPFVDFSDGSTRPGCQLKAGGTGEQFSSFGQVQQQIDGIVRGRGWVADPQLVADGPIGSVVGYRQGGATLLSSVEWIPSADANCPPDQIITDCELTPAQQLYTLSVSAAPAQ